MLTHLAQSRVFTRSTHRGGVCAGVTSSDRVSTHTGLCACGCGAVVAHHLAKVRVASSNLVIRSEKPRDGVPLRWCGREARQRPAKPFTRVRIPSPPRITKYWAIGAAVARFPDTEEVTGSIPVSPTRLGRSATRELFGGDIEPEGFPSRLMKEPLFIRVGAQMGPRLRSLLYCTIFAGDPV